MSTKNLGDYTVLEQLGEGTLGTVYRALDGRNSRTVALRILTGEIRWDAELRCELHRVCEALSRLHHPNIAQVYEFGEEAGALFMATELIEGKGLRPVAADASVKVEKRISLMQQVAAALGYAHDNGILHRDLRPADIFVCADGTVKIVDFSVAHLLARALTRPPLRWGAPIYLAPEQIGEKHYDARSEIFVAGMIFYELFTQLHPFQDGNSNRVLDNILAEECLPGFEPFEDAPPGLCGILEKCLAKDPDERFQRMTEVAGACFELLDDIGRECHAMLVELQVAVPRLKRAAGRRGAPGELAALLGDIQRVVAGEQGRDYATLDSLMSALAAQNASIYALLGGSRRRRGPQPSAEPAAPREAPIDTTGGVPASRSEERAGAEVSDPLPASVAKPEPGTGADRPDRRTGPELETSAPLALDCHELDFLQSSLPDGAGSEPRSGVADAPAPDQTPVPPEGIFPAGQSEPVPARHFWFARPAIWAAVVIAFLALVAASVWVLRSGGVARAMPGLDSLAKSGPQGVVVPATSRVAVPAADKPAAAELLVRQAEAMTEQGRVVEGRLFLNRALELEPEYAPAKALRDRLEAEDSVRGESGTLRKQITAAGALIASGQLRRARVEINRIAASSPDHPALIGLRRNWDARNAELSRESERKKAAAGGGREVRCGGRSLVPAHRRPFPRRQVCRGPARGGRVVDGKPGQCAGGIHAWPGSRGPAVDCCRGACHRRQALPRRHHCARAPRVVEPFRSRAARVAPFFGDQEGGGACPAVGAPPGGTGRGFV